MPDTVSLAYAKASARKPIDVERLRRLTDSMPPASESAADLVRRMRDESY